MILAALSEEGVWGGVLAEPVFAATAAALDSSQDLLLEQHPGEEVDSRSSLSRQPHHPRLTTTPARRRRLLLPLAASVIPSSILVLCLSLTLSFLLLAFLVLCFHPRGSLWIADQG